MEADLLGEFRYDTLKVYYRKGTEDEKVLSHSFGNDIYFKEIPSFRPRRNSIIIDVGAHIGTFSLLASLRYPESRIFALEASRETFDILNKNILVNNLPITAFHKALLDRKGAVRLYHDNVSGNWGHSITKAFASSSEEVNAITLEHLVGENDIDFIDLAKFNCEGSEFSILMKTPKAILEKIGLGIILYHEDLAEKEYCLENLLSLFDKNSFRTLVIRKSPKRGWLIVWNRKRYSSLYFLLSAIYRRLTR
ncbi:MAG TPA: FkbM family methyltransferase [Cyclobacteriaceae bacterium]